jgi:hypothetical protein
MHPISVRKAPRIDEFYQKCADPLRSPDARTFYEKNYKPVDEFTYEDIVKFMTGHLVHVQPDFLVVNQGHWQFPFIRSDPGLSIFVNATLYAVRRPGAMAIWKTTTAKQYNPKERIDLPDFLQAIKRRGMYVFDAWNITQALSMKPDAFYDAFHFEPFVYRELNIAMLNFLGQFTKQS